MSAEVFLDTNVLVYAVDSEATSTHKRRRGRDLILAGNFGVSGQVLQEFYVVTTRKLARPLPPAVATRWVARLSAAAFVPTDASLIKAAIEGSIRWQISYWDAAIVAAADALGARTLYSEDLSHGQVYGSVTVHNPFLESG